MRNSIKDTISCFLIVIGLILFFGALIDDSINNRSKSFNKEVKCYDKYGNEIIGQTCIGSFVEPNPYSILYFIIAVIGLIMFFIGLLSFFSREYIMKYIKTKKKGCGKRTKQGYCGMVDEIKKDGQIIKSYCKDCQEVAQTKDGGKK